MSANKFLDRKRCIGWILIAVVSIVTAAKSKFYDEIFIFKRLGHARR